MISNLSSKESGCGCGSGGSTAAAPCGCGGAGCGTCVAQGIVRPRFFAGQLLTEDDLQLLSDYVGHKNRLHNRHLFGAGVVCGLEVTCDPCGDGRVIVHPGYAIDCCGNDLTLSCAYSVDLNALVRKLRKNECEEPCPDPKKLKPRAEEKDDNEESDEPKPNFRYCLYIRYCEQPSDPVTPYSTGEECVQVGCEPTRIREGVSFELRCVDPRMARNPLLERLCQKLGDLDKFPKVFDAFSVLRDEARNLADQQALIESPLGFFSPLDDDAVRTKARRIETKRLSTQALLVARDPFEIVRNWLIERISKASFVTDCTLKTRVFNLALPGGDDPDFVIGKETIQDLIVAFIDYLRASVCSVLNPACLPCEDSAVLLACLDWEECEVKRICNMERTFVLSPAAVRYWLPPLQLAGNVLEQLCCLPWEDLPREQRSGDPDLKELFIQEIKRLIKDSMCGVSDERLDNTLEQIFGERTKKPFDLNMFGGRRSTTPVTASPLEDLVPESTITFDSTAAVGGTKSGAKKTGMKSGKKAASKSGSKAPLAATKTSNPGNAATPAATKTSTPAAVSTAATTAEGDQQ